MFIVLAVVDADGEAREENAVPLGVETLVPHGRAGDLQVGAGGAFDVAVKAAEGFRPSARRTR